MYKERVIQFPEDILFHHDPTLLFFLFNVFFFHGFESIESLGIFFSDEHDLGIGSLADNREHMKLFESLFGLVLFHSFVHVDNNFIETKSIERLIHSY